MFWEEVRTVARIVIAGSSAQSREQTARLLSSSGYPVYRLCTNAGELRRVLNDEQYNTYMMLFGATIQNQRMK